MMEFILLAEVCRQIGNKHVNMLTNPDVSMILHIPNNPQDTDLVITMSWEFISIREENLGCVCKQQARWSKGPGMNLKLLTGLWSNIWITSKHMAISRCRNFFKQMDSTWLHHTMVITRKKWNKGIDHFGYNYPHGACNIWFYSIAYKCMWNSNLFIAVRRYN